MELALEKCSNSTKEENNNRIEENRKILNFNFDDFKLNKSTFKNLKKNALCAQGYNESIFR